MTPAIGEQQPLKFLTALPPPPLTGAGRPKATTLVSEATARAERVQKAAHLLTTTSLVGRTRDDAPMVAATSLVNSPHPNATLSVSPTAAGGKPTSSRWKLLGQ